MKENCKIGPSRLFCFNSKWDTFLWFIRISRRRQFLNPIAIDALNLVDRQHVSSLSDVERPGVSGYPNISSRSLADDASRVARSFPCAVIRDSPVCSIRTQSRTDSVDTFSNWIWCRRFAQTATKNASRCSLCTSLLIRAFCQTGVFRLFEIPFAMMAWALSPGIARGKTVLVEFVQFWNWIQSMSEPFDFVSIEMIMCRAKISLFSRFAAIDVDRLIFAMRLTASGKVGRNHLFISTENLNENKTMCERISGRQNGNAYK